MLPGIWFLIKETSILDTAATTVRHIHITEVTFKLEVTAKAEHIPKI
jgi:hypothetical protein